VKLPDTLAQLLEQRSGARLHAVSAVSGGCISNTARVEFANREVVFLKWAHSSEQPAAMFSEEARSLRALAATKTVRVPAVLDQHAEGDYVWLLLEWLEPGPRSSASQAQLGEALAALHQHTAETYGWLAANFIGSLPQSNRQHTSWPEFWREERLLPQLRLGASRLDAEQRRRLTQLIERCDEVIGDSEADGPSLLHGDLWGGNLHITADGTAALIDPSSYYGHREVDLAMAQLFGGFSADFFGSYERAWPCRPGLEQRLLLYQLYYLLVHVNLFGGGYAAQTMQVAERLGF
jgi:fructosamine-3-kinase